jgi:hypothetical protein
MWAEVKFSIKGYFDTRLPGQSYFGAEPVGLAVNTNGSRLYVANMASDAVAVFDTRKLTAKASKAGMVEPIGFVPTEWMPISMAFLPSASGGNALCGHREREGNGAEQFSPAPAATSKGTGSRSSTYIATLLYGSLAALDDDGDRKQPCRSGRSVVLDSNRMKAAAARRLYLPAAGGTGSST